jgi:acetylornithine deacetylase
MFHAGTYPSAIPDSAVLRGGLGVLLQERVVDQPIVQTVSRVYTRATGQAPVVSGRTGGADTRYLIKHGRTPTVIFGPGVTSEVHALNESVPIAHLLAATKSPAPAAVEWRGVA